MRYRVIYFQCYCYLALPLCIVSIVISGGHTGGASGAVHQGPRPLGAHQRGPDSNFLEKLISYVSHVGGVAQW